MTAQASCDNEPTNVAVNPLPFNEVSTSPDQNIKNIHQDDDGFESLNGNVSSDNDRGLARATIEKPKHKKNMLAANSEEHMFQQILSQSKFSGLICISCFIM